MHWQQLMGASTNTASRGIARAPDYNNNLSSSMLPLLTSRPCTLTNNCNVVRSIHKRQVATNVLLGGIYNTLAVPSVQPYVRHQIPFQFPGVTVQIPFSFPGVSVPVQPYVRCQIPFQFPGVPATFAKVTSSRGMPGGQMTLPPQRPVNVIYPESRFFLFFAPPTPNAFSTGAVRSSNDNHESVSFVENCKSIDADKRFPSTHCSTQDAPSSASVLKSTGDESVDKYPTQFFSSSGTVQNSSGDNERVSFIENHQSVDDIDNRCSSTQSVTQDILSSASIVESIDVESVDTRTQDASSAGAVNNSSGDSERVSFIENHQSIDADKRFSSAQSPTHGDPSNTNAVKSIDDESVEVPTQDFSNAGAVKSSSGESEIVSFMENVKITNDDEELSSLDTLTQDTSSVGAVKSNHNELNESQKGCNIKSSGDNVDQGFLLVEALGMQNASSSVKRSSCLETPTVEASSITGDDNQRFSLAEGSLIVNVNHVVLDNDLSDTKKLLVPDSVSDSEVTCGLKAKTNCSQQSLLEDAIVIDDEDSGQRSSSVHTLTEDPSSAYSEPEFKASQALVASVFASSSVPQDSGLLCGSQRRAKNKAMRQLSWTSSTGASSRSELLAFQPLVASSQAASGISVESKPLSMKQRHRRNRALRRLINGTFDTGASDNTNSSKAYSQPELSAIKPLIALVPASSTSVGSEPLFKSQKRAQNKAKRQLNGTPNNGASDSTDSLKMCRQSELSAFQPSVASIPASSTSAASKPLSKSHRHRRNRALRQLLNGKSKTDTSNKGNSVERSSAAVAKSEDDDLKVISTTSTLEESKFLPELLLSFTEDLTPTVRTPDSADRKTMEGMV